MYQVSFRKYFKKKYIYCFTLNKFSVPGSEDGTVRVWHANTHRLESSLNYGFERVWTICCLKGSNNVALGYDEGSILVKVGREEPAASMDASGGKIIWARHSELQQANLKALPEGKCQKQVQYNCKVTNVFLQKPK